MALALALVPIQSISELEAVGYQALRNGDIEQVTKVAATIAEQHPDSFSAAMARGSLLLRAGIPNAALIAFDEAAKLRPKQIPYMWQRGIAQYYAGQYEAGRKQFVVHREVNSNDVENAVWHFMCVTKLKSIDEASKGYLPAPGDSRAPMQQVYDLFGGTASIEDVTKVMARYPADSRAGASAGFYGELYLGIYEDMRGNTDAALEWLGKAVARGQTHYMADVARVHLDQLRQQAGKQASDK